MRYRAEVDGLRAIAVIPVVLYHAAVPGFHGGYAGVDVFFVISGYLITGILLREIGTGIFSVAQFYERRARRILPALALVLACTIPPALAWMTPLQLREYSQSVIAVLAFVANVFFLREADYFAADSETLPLLHTWSLAVEEQYYFIFPWLLVLASARRLRPFVIVAALSVVSLVLSELELRRDPPSAFFLLPSRAWELGAGALVAIAHAAPGERSRETLIR